MGDCKMKSVFNKIEKEKSKEIEFPVLAQSNYNNIVVLFTDATSGVVVKNNEYTSIGNFSNDYRSIHDKNIWRILSPEESIVLSND